MSRGPKGQGRCPLLGSWPPSDVWLRYRSGSKVVVVVVVQESRLLYYVTRETSSIWLNLVVVFLSYFD